MTNDQLQALIDAITKIAHGPLSGANAQPMGLEAVVMSIAKQGGDTIVDALNNIAESIRDYIAPALTDINDTLTRIEFSVDND